MQCEYVTLLSDVDKILCAPEIMVARGKRGDTPVMGCIYVGCWEDDIVSLLVFYGGLVHFYVLEEYRRKAREYFEESFKKLPERDVYCAIPKDRRKLINFALKVGFDPYGVRGDDIVMVRYYG